ncbi:restriction endonuclease subunit S [Nocardia otitidiscaviarum]|uniref:restriction endonuclease subunit S n=1 Tax=Nocardia otitidiscaviarum TaxID=1823 RepID=UPI001893C4F2|nr:restriction endonuclease subunit S [Nocardia otitidiscaviarum]MBF6177284.1 restriction endonuclease subunit S [Nocardia otitidiscaviarum]
MKARIATIGSISEQIRGVTYAKGDSSSTLRPGLLPILRAGNISDAGISFNDLVYVPEGKIAAKQMLRKGDILVAASSGSLDVVGKAAQLRNDFDGAFGAFCKVIRPSSSVDSRYLGHFFTTSEYRRRVSALAAGANINNLKNGHLDDLMIWLPPLDEQRRIADVLDRVDALREKRRRAIALLDDLAQSIFLDMFGDPVRNDRGWSWSTVDDFVQEFQSGKSLAAGGDEKVNEFRILKISAVTSGIFDPRESKPAPAGYRPPDSHLVVEGDLLFSRANTAELIGATALVDGAPENLALPDKLWRFVWHRPLRANPIFVHYLFAQPTFREQIGRASTGSSGSMKNISQGKVMALRTGLPPLELQVRFAERVGALHATRNRHKAHIAELDALFASLQSRAFRGEL